LRGLPIRYWQTKDVTFCTRNSANQIESDKEIFDKQIGGEMTESNSRFRAGEVAAELRNINARLDEIAKNQHGIQAWQLEVVKCTSTINERVTGLRHDLTRSDRAVGAIAVIISAVFSSIAGFFGMRH
jgi:hypothetical protein